MKKPAMIRKNVTLRWASSDPSAAIANKWRAMAVGAGK
jgi:hypothetical protein